MVLVRIREGTKESGRGKMDGSEEGGKGRRMRMERGRNGAENI